MSLRRDISACVHCEWLRCGCLSPSQRISHSLGVGVTFVTADTCWEVNDCKLRMDMLTPFLQRVPNQYLPCSLQRQSVTIVHSRRIIDLCKTEIN